MVLNIMVHISRIIQTEHFSDMKNQFSFLPNSRNVEKRNNRTVSVYPVSLSEIE